MSEKVLPFTRWPWLAAAGVEGLCLLIPLSLHLAESLLLLAALEQNTPQAYALAAGAAVGGGVLTAPLRWGLWRWYGRLRERPGQPPSATRLFAGYRRPLAAVGWRWAVWWRQTVLFLTAAIPAALLWGYGDWLTRKGEPALSLLYLVLGGLVLLGAAIVTALRRCRYALVPLLLERGCSAPLAMQLSLRLTRRRTGQWVNFWGDRTGWLLLCLLPGGCLWALPRLRWAYLALLEGWLDAADFGATRNISSFLSGTGKFPPPGAY